jgi:hypothetical protein
VDCERADLLLNARLDGELDSAGPDAVELGAHLSSCAACRSVAAALQANDGELRAAFAKERAGAPAVADRAIARLRRDVSRGNGAWWRRAELLVAAAAGFLLAFVLLRPWEAKQHTTQVVNNPSSPVPATAQATFPATEETPLATLALATGAVECRAAGAWHPMPTGGTVRPGDVIRTGPKVRCEFTTAEGSLVRVNEQTQLTFVQPRLLELAGGQVWSTVAKAPEPFRVKVPKAEVTALGTQFDLACPEPSKVTLTVVEGSTRVKDQYGEKTVRSGERLTISGGRAEDPVRAWDLYVATRWVNELLVMKGRDNAELSKRIDSLFAQIGRVKISSMYEEEIRALGDHCVVPLTQFLCENGRQDTDEQRRSAARILADVAQPWSAGELIKLLPDRDGEVRYHAARALQRVTGTDMGRSPEQWRDEPAERGREALRQWQAWWAQNRDRYPRLPTQ